VCFVLLRYSQDYHRIEHVILASLYLTGTKTLIVGMPRRGIYSVLFLYIILMVPSST
jgi:hypothetical protein